MTFDPWGGGGGEGSVTKMYTAHGLIHGNNIYKLQDDSCQSFCCRVFTRCAEGYTHTQMDIITV